VIASSPGGAINASAGDDILMGELHGEHITRKILTLEM